MSNYNSLKTTIDANIKQNGNQEITGQILNSVLNQMVNILGTGYQFAGVATIATNPGTPDAKVFYIANGKGTYTNFGGINVTEDDVVVLYWDSSWHKVSTGIASQEKLSELGKEVLPLGDTTPMNVLLNQNNTFIFQEDATGYFIKCSGKQRFYISSTAGVNVIFAFVKSIPTSSGDSPDYATGSSRQLILGDGYREGNVPSDANYLYVSRAVGNTDWMPRHIILDEYDYILGMLGTFGQNYERMDNMDTRMDNLDKSMARFPVSTDPGFNAICKECYIPASEIADLTTISRIRIYNGYGGYSGAQILLSDGTIINVREVTKAYAGPIFFQTGGGDCAMLIDLSGVESGSYADYNTPSLNSNVVRTLALNPTLYDVVNNLPNFASNKMVCFHLRALYISDSVLSSAQLSNVAYVRITWNSNGGCGVALRDANNVLIDTFVLSTAPSSNKFWVGPVYMEISDLLDQTNIIYPTTLNPALVQDMSTFPELDAYRISILENEKNKDWFVDSDISPVAAINDRPVMYDGDTKSASNFINNAVIYPDGVIIAARANATIVRIALDGTETTLLALTGNNTEWRGLFMDSNLNVYASPHATLGSLKMTDRGLYKLAYGANSFTKVISLYDPNSQDTPVTQQNDDTIWTMCEDAGGYLYAGVYAHTTRPSPRIYRSTDGGDTWVDLFDFSTLAPTGKHIHTINYNEFNDALYAIVGEVNTIFKSTDKGTSWTNLNVQCEGGKGTAMLAVPDGIIIGSDSAYSLIMSKLYRDTKVDTKGRFWANTCFGIRRSDVTGWIYAFGKIDSSVNSTDYMPPIGAITDPVELQTWINSSPTHLAEWQAYNNDVKGIYPDDAIRPQHYAVIRSKDNGETWECVYRGPVSSAAANGIWCIGYFRNGECLAGRIVGNSVIQPIIISEGKHKYGANGLNLDGEILVRTNTSDDVTPL